MSNKARLRINRTATVINKTSKHEDSQCMRVIRDVIGNLELKYGVNIIWEKRLFLKDIIASLRENYPSVSFADPLPTSFMMPDGGICYIIGKGGRRYPLLISEVKNQGTNDIREKEGKSKQPKGNAVERLGKNVIGFRALLLNESIFPFVCFGDGCDFAAGSSILDRVITIAMFGALNEDHTANEGANGIFNRGSYYFREEKWSEQDMLSILYDVAKRSMYYYFAKYGEENFRTAK